MKTILRFRLLPTIITLMLTSCTTMNKTLFYSSVGGALTGGFIGKEVSPNKRSNNLNMAIGATAGAATASLIGHYFYRDANPASKLDVSPLKKEIPIVPIEDNTFGLDKININPKFSALGEKKYINLSDNVPKDIKKIAKRQYFKRYQTESYSFEKDGKKYQVPVFEIIESGIE